MALEIDKNLQDTADSFSHLERIYTGRSAHFEAESEPQAINLDASNIKLSAFYLPQFHQTAVNDKAWGKGFTEWTNVTRSQPYFKGHRQPHLPEDLGYYDLSRSQTLSKQALLAKQYGIDSFSFYYYWFGGKKVLNNPIETLLENPSIDIRFSICWANENWTKRWDGLDEEIILRQPHTIEIDKNFIFDILKFLEDPRYLRVDNKPILTLYKPYLLGSHLEQTLDFWRNVVSNEGLGELMVFGTTADPHLNDANIQRHKLNGSIQFPPHRHWNYSLTYNKELFFNKNFSGSIGDYNHAIQFHMDELNNSNFLIPGVYPSWDNTARKRSNSRIYINSTPKKYGSWLKKAILKSKSNKVAAGMVFINAWNEWAEGCHLEPCRWYGHAYLNSTREALLNHDC